MHQGGNSGRIEGENTCENTLHEVGQRLWIAEGAEDVMLHYKV